VILLSVAAMAAVISLAVFAVVRSKRAGRPPQTMAEALNRAFEQNRDKSPADQLRAMGKARVRYIKKHGEPDAPFDDSGFY